MWDLVRKLRADGTTIILTTHYIEEAEEMADRVGVISRGELIAVDEKKSLMAKMGRRRSTSCWPSRWPRFRPSLATGTSGSEMTATSSVTSSTAMPSGPASRR